ncbi:MAG: four helix bundle protein [Dinghuibacter sp.]|nr:four helix bundle protein [Dinghuibacter sp.]
MSRNFNLDERLIDFAVTIISITEQMDKTVAAKHIGAQLLRSGTSPALHYGEAQSAESRVDFIHKLKVLLKELRESSSAMRIALKAKLAKEKEMMEQALAECNELISIFVTSVSTAKKNLELEKRKRKE